MISSIEAGILLNSVSILLNLTTYKYEYDRDIANYLIAFAMLVYLIFFFTYSYHILNHNKLKQMNFPALSYKNFFNDLITKDELIFQ